MKITEKQIRKMVQEALKETPKFEKNWDKEMKQDRRISNFVNDTFGKGANPYDSDIPSNFIDAMMNNGRIAKHLANRGKKHAMEESLIDDKPEINNSAKINLREWDSVQGGIDISRDLERLKQQEQFRNECLEWYKKMPEKMTWEELHDAYWKHYDALKQNASFYSLHPTPEYNDDLNENKSIKKISESKLNEIISKFIKKVLNERCFDYTEPFDFERQKKSPVSELMNDIRKVNWVRVGTDTKWAPQANAAAEAVSKKWGLSYYELRFINFYSNYQEGNPEEEKKAEMQVKMLINKALNNKNLFNKQKKEPIPSYYDDEDYMKITESQLRNIIAESIKKALNERDYDDANDWAQEKWEEEMLKKHLSTNAAFNTYEDFKRWLKYSDNYMHEAHLYYDTNNNSFKLKKDSETDIDIIVYPSSLTLEGDDWGYGATYGGLVPEGLYCYCPTMPEIEGDAEEFIDDNLQIQEQLIDSMF